LEQFAEGGEGLVEEVVGEDVEEGVANQRDIGEQEGVSGAGAVLALEGGAAPVIADFNAAPVAPALVLAQCRITSAQYWLRVTPISAAWGSTFACNPSSTSITLTPTFIALLHPALISAF
jgi:hypothetical protein